MSAQVPAISAKIQIQTLPSFCVVSNTDILEYSQGNIKVSAQSTGEIFRLPKLKDCVGKCFGPLKILK